MSKECQGKSALASAQLAIQKKT